MHTHYLEWQMNISTLYMSAGFVRYSRDERPFAFLKLGFSQKTKPFVYKIKTTLEREIVCVITYSKQQTSFSDSSPTIIAHGFLFDFKSNLAVILQVQHRDRIITLQTYAIINSCFNNSKSPFSCKTALLVSPLSLVPFTPTRAPTTPMGIQYGSNDTKIQVLLPMQI